MPCKQNYPYDIHCRSCNETITIRSQDDTFCPRLGSFWNCNLCYHKEQYGKKEQTYNNPITNYFKKKQK